MNKNEREIINYKKEHKKSLHKYIAMMHMAQMFCMMPEYEAKLFDIVDEPELDDFDFDRILDRDGRIRAVFGTSPFYTFDEEYPNALRIASEKIKIMNN